MKLARRWPAVALVCLLFSCLSTACGLEPTEGNGDGATRVPFAASATVGDLIWSGCSTSVVNGLAQQLIDEVRCLEPTALVSIADLPRASFGAAAHKYLQKSAADALRRAVARRPGATLTLNSVLRTLPQQYLLYQWYQNTRCDIPLAAEPGRSPHESGLALDVAETSSWRWALSAEGWGWHGSGDPPHYDYYGAGRDLRYFSVLAFQRLWNRNNPSDRIGEDGSYGGATQTRLSWAPAAGFTKGSACAQPLVEPALPPIEVYWRREADGRYALRALASSKVVAVRYVVDGYVLDPPGKVTRAAGANFPGSYRFSDEQSERHFEVRGYDAANTLIAKGVGLLDVTAGTAVYIRQLGSKLYEIGLERAPAGVAAIEVRADSWQLKDSVSGQLRSTRKAVRSSFSQLGERTFTIDTFNADGSHRGTLRRTFTLR